MSNRRIDVNPRAELEAALGYKFNKQDLLHQALTHTSGVTEWHSLAFSSDLMPLAFVGDAALKYAVARYLFLNGEDHVIRSQDEMHNASLRIITNSVLGEIARDQLHIERYLICGNNHREPSESMYASCMEAIFGAIALDCGSNQQEVIFRVVERLCSQRVENLLRQPPQSRLASFTNEYEWMSQHNIIWPKTELEAALQNCRRAPPLHQNSCWQTLCNLSLWFFAIIGFITFCIVIFFLASEYYSRVPAKKHWYEL